MPRRSGRARLGAWIRRVTANVAYQEMRLSYRRPKEVEYEEELDASYDAPERSLRAGELYRALEIVPPKLRIVLVLYDVEGQTMKESGAVLGRPLPTIQSQLKAARTKLAEALLDTGSESKAHTEDAEGRR